MKQLNKKKLKCKKNKKRIEEFRIILMKSAIGTGRSKNGRNPFELAEINRSLPRKIK